jgi:hypothetical protein
MEDEGDDLAINELFVQETVDPRIESVMPILSKLRKNVAEMSEIDTLAEWADSIISEKLEMDSTTKSMAVPADEMLDEAPGAETLAHNQSTEKKNLKAFGLAEETGEEPPIGKGKKAFIVTSTDGKKVTVLADHDWQAKETAKNHWKLTNDAGIIVKQKEVPGAGTTSTSAPAGKDSAINKATAKAKPAQPDNQTEPTSTWGRVKDAVKKNWNVPGGDDSYGGTAKAIAGMFEGDVVPFKKKHDDEDDDSWMPSVDDFEQEEKNRNRKRGPANDIDENFISMAPQAVAEGHDDGYQSGIRAYNDGLPLDHNPYADDPDMWNSPEAEAWDKGWKDADDGNIKEDLDANQKRVGQLGPTEKVKNNNIGKLVGASESTEIDPELARIIEMARFKR